MTRVVSLEALSNSIGNVVAAAAAAAVAPPAAAAALFGAKN